MENAKYNGFERRRLKKKNDIIAAARKLLLGSDPKGATIADIAREANVSQVSIYNFFGSKENLLREVFFCYMNEAFDSLQRVMDSDLSFREKVSFMFDMNKASAGAITPEAYTLMQWDDPLVKEFQNEYAQKKAFPQIMQLIEQGKREGQISPELDIETILLFIGAFQHIVSSPGVANKWEQRQREQLNQLFFYGLFGQPK